MIKLRNIFLSVCVAGVVYLLVELWRPARVQYYETTYGIRQKVDYKTDDRSYSVNWMALGLAIFSGGIIFALQPLKEKK